MVKKSSRNVLITAGPTWVALDSIRIISNIASGQIGFLLAKEARKKSYKVTLALGPVGYINSPRGVKVKPFRYFDELLQLIKKEVASKKYDTVIHAAAISDYKPFKKLKGKIKSGIKNLTIKFKATPKIVNCIKKSDPNVFLVLFKLESGVSDKTLISRARKTLLKAKGDLIIANRIEPTYKAFILDKSKVYARASSKQELAKTLFRVIPEKQK